MSRRHAAEKRVILPDIKYNSILLSKFINNNMKERKPALAEKIIYSAFNKIEKKHRVDPYQTFNNAMHNVKPHLEVISVKVGGANYQFPTHVDARRVYALASRWINNAASKRSEKIIIDKLAEELFEASNNRGVAIRKKEDTHKMAKANKAFFHFSPKKMK